MLSAIITVAIAFVLLLELIGLGPSTLNFASLAVVVGVSVGLVGIPHGGLDHVAGRNLFKRSYPKGLATFFLLYLLIATAVVAGWHLSPLVTIIAFFGLSAWHFGREEDEQRRRNLMHWAGLIARGGMVIWVPAIFQEARVTKLLSMVVPSGDMLVASEVVRLVQVAAPLLAALTAIDLWKFASKKSSQVKGESKSGFGRFLPGPVWQHRLRVTAFFALFSASHPLVSFGIYFCGWHSIRGLIHLHEEYGGTASSFGFRLLPVSIAALVLLSGGLYFWTSSDEITPAIVRTMFIGLSALAVPHLLLHIASDTWRPSPHRSRNLPRDEGLDIAA